MKRLKREADPGQLTLLPDPMMRACFLLHVLPEGFHHVRRYGLFATGHSANTIEHTGTPLGVSQPTG